MAKGKLNQKFSLEKEGPKIIEISWTGIFHDVAVHYEGEQVGEALSAEEIREGADFMLPDGSKLRLRYARETKYSIFPSLQVLREGMPLPGSSTHPDGKLSTASNILLILGAFGIFQNLAAPTSIAFLVGGLGLVLLGYFVRRGSRLALYIASAYFLLTILNTILWGFQTSQIGRMLIFLVFDVAIFFFLLPALRTSSPKQSGSEL